MSTASFDRPLRAVFTPTDAAEAAQALQAQKSRWGAFLVARDVLLGVWHGATAHLSSIVERLHLSGALQMARRGLGWLLGGLARTSHVLRTPGVRPALLWALTSTQGQKIAGKVMRPVLSTARQCLTWTVQAGIGVLRRLGTPGRTTAAWLTNKTVASKAFLSTKVRPVAEIAMIVLSPSGLVVKAVNGWARARTITAVVVRFLPRPWNILGRVLAAYVAVPRSVREQLISRLPSGPQDDTTPPAAAAATRSPATASAPTVISAQPVVTDDNDPAEVPVAAEVIDLDAERLKHEAAALDELVEAMPGLQRYPAPKRSANAKKRK